MNDEKHDGPTRKDGGAPPGAGGPSGPPSGPPGAPRSGDVLEGRWRLDEKLGEGGAAYVFAATNVSEEAIGTVKPGERAAVKIAGRKMTPYQAALFGWEPEKVKQVDSPNVLHPIDVGADDVFGPFFVMPLLEGKTVRALWEEHHRDLPVSMILDIARQTLDVLIVAHRAGIIHRDIKPTNLFMTPEGRLFVLDFGVAKMIGAIMTNTGSLLGTLGFCAPEQVSAEKRPIDARTDVWGLGATMFFLLARRRVFEGTEQERQIRTATWDPPSIGAHLPSLAPGVQHLIDKALRREPGERWQSAEEMLRALKALSGAD
jgi:eukaryotic-like serine/threonine-protein kinase